MAVFILILCILKLNLITLSWNRKLVRRRKKNSSGNKIALKIFVISLCLKIVGGEPFIVENCVYHTKMFFFVLSISFN